MADKDFSRKLKDLRLKAGCSQKEVYEHFGIPQSTFSSWEVGKSEPPGDMLIKLCQFYKCDMINSLSSDKEDSVTYEEWKMVEKYRLISTHSPDGAVVVDTVLDREFSIAEKIREQKEQLEQIQKMDMEVAEEFIPKRILAYYGKIAAAGKSYGFDDVIAGTIECPLTDESQRADYAIGVSGDSMEPTFYDGDIVYVSKNAHLGIGDIGIFQKDNGIYIKEVGENELISHNPEYKPIVNNEDILCLGKVVGKVEE